MVLFFSTRQQLLQIFILTWICGTTTNWPTTHYFPARWCTTTLGTPCLSVPLSNISRLMDWNGWTNFMATSSARYHSLGLLFMGLCKRYHLSKEGKDIDDLKQRIHNAIATIDGPMLQQTWQEVEYWLDVLHATNGAHIEVY